MYEKDSTITTNIQSAEFASNLTDYHPGNLLQTSILSLMYIIANYMIPTNDLWINYAIN